MSVVVRGCLFFSFRDGRVILVCFFFDFLLRVAVLRGREFDGGEVVRLSGEFWGESGGRL